MALRKLKHAEVDCFRFIIPRNNGEISNSITQNWTDQAIRCYQSNCNCTSCSIGQSNYSFICQMPKVVKLLISQLGPPDEQRIKKILA